MSPLVIGVIGIVVMLLLFATRMRVGYCMAIAGFLGFSYLVTMDAGLSILGSIPYYTTASYTLSVIPLFVLMGQFAFHSGISADLYKAAYAWVGQLRGGLAMSSIAACAAFGALTGSTTAATATMGAISLPEMKRYNYQVEMSTAAVAAGASLSLLIPPSLGFIIYGLLTEESIGRLFIAGIFPGLLLMFLLMCAVYVRVRQNPSLGPPGPRLTFRERLRTIRVAWVVVVIFLLIMGGIYMGVFTPTEAAGVGAFLTLLFGLITRRISWQGILASFRDTMSITAMVFVLVIGALIFSRFLTVTRIPFELAEFIGGLVVSRYIALVGILAFFTIFGCFMDALPVFLITVPIFFPVVVGLGFDPLWFGVIMVLMANIAVITPPVGINAYVIAGVAKVPIETVFKGVLPFLIAMAICAVILIAFPQIVLFLPNLMK